MRTDRSLPQPVMEQLVKGHGWPWEHRCEQFTCVARNYLRAGNQGGGIFLVMPPLGFFSKPWSLASGEPFLLYHWTVATIFLVWSKTGWRQLCLWLPILTHTVLCPLTESINQGLGKGLLRVHHSQAAQHWEHLGLQGFFGSLLLYKFLWKGFPFLAVAHLTESYFYFLFNSKNVEFPSRDILQVLLILLTCLLLL